MKKHAIHLLGIIGLLAVLLAGLIPAAAQGPDSDNDGIADDIETMFDMNPNSADTDGDGLPDGDEFGGATSPRIADTDGDGLNDGHEVGGGTDPNKRDSDGDGIWDGAEVNIGTDPTKRDSDGDTLDDGVERHSLGTDPTNGDSDGDGWRDGLEVANGFNPLDPASPDQPAPAIVPDIIWPFESIQGDTTSMMYPNGSQSIYNSATSVHRTRWPNGVAITYAPDGSAQGSRPDGTTLTQTPDGQVTISPFVGSPYNVTVNSPPTMPYERPGDVYNYDLNTMLPNFDYVDIFCNPIVAVSGWPQMPTLNDPYDPQTPWGYFYGGYPQMGGILPVLPGSALGSVDLTGSGSAGFGLPDSAVIYIDSAQWYVNLPNPGSPLETRFTDQHSGLFAIRTNGGTPAPSQVSNSFFQADFDGTYAAVLYNAVVPRSATIYLAEGTSSLTTSASETPTTFVGPDDGQTVLRIVVTEAGAVTQDTILLADFEMMLPPGFQSDALLESIVVQIPMSAPAPMAGEAQIVWHVMLDLDGDPTTGLPPDVHPTYSGLGVEFELSAWINDEGQIQAEGFFNIGGATVPAEAVLSADRQTVAIFISLAALQEQAAAQGYTVLPEAMRWRVSAVDYMAENQPKDVYPEITFSYDTGMADGPATGPTPPVGATVSISMSMSGGGPMVTFEDKSTSPDPNNAITGRLWDFGDGTTSTEPNPQHSYAQPGEYTATLTITFSNGSTMTGQIPVNITVGSGEAPAPTVTDACTATATGGANLRGGPGTAFDRVGGVEAGDLLIVTAQNTAGDWYKLRIEGIDNAWIADFLITPPVCPEGITLAVEE
jgi:hypothetical protein